MSKFYVYILTNFSKTVLYIGITRDLSKRLSIHSEHSVNGFTARYHVDRLIYVEEYSTATEAIAREKQLKRWSRSKKERLIKQVNPNWDELEF